MSPDFVGAKAGHEANKKSTQYRDNDHPVPQRTAGRRDRHRAEPVIVEKVGRECDQSKKQHREESRANTDNQGHSGKKPDSRIHSEVAENGGFSFHVPPKWLVSLALCGPLA